MVISVGADEGMRPSLSTAMSTEELLGEVASVVPHGHARRLVMRARRIAGIRDDESLETRDLLIVLEAIASEGGPLQVLAESLAHRALSIHRALNTQRELNPARAFNAEQALRP